MKKMKSSENIWLSFPLHNRRRSRHIEAWKQITPTIGPYLRLNPRKKHPGLAKRAGRYYSFDQHCPQIQRKRSL